MLFIPHSKKMTHQLISGFASLRLSSLAEINHDQMLILQGMIISIASQQSKATFIRTNPSSKGQYLYSNFTLKGGQNSLQIEGSLSLISSVEKTELCLLQGLSHAALALYKSLPSEQSLNLSYQITKHQIFGISEPVFLSSSPKSAIATSLEGIATAVINLSTRAYHGQYEDTGPLVVEYLEQLGAHISEYTLIPDDICMLKQTISNCILRAKPTLLVLHGGTGSSNDDMTPETLDEIGEVHYPQIGEYIRVLSSQYTPFAWYSRCKAVRVSQTFIISLPGSTPAIKEILYHIAPLIKQFIKDQHG
ncbi:molybdopterin-binding protein [Legionella jamestowniensis]|uniref:Molybdopterin adenylyltransferase n=1 Tax=Legionella jamestowniensis TaxID=455 RepID=A0A0W0UJV5_9GAMM|nr:molybdopterin-binding protein [Legionella jamestowniensis]KTD08193.1 Molybdopterin adenylyltransferase [Legionella jamestowniensis]SFL98647.1 molybdenum cofactor synthesis domain-containing protein [Legionella jamestowniensis DSM 19215]